MNTSQTAGTNNQSLPTIHASAPTTHRSPLTTDQNSPPTTHRILVCDDEAHILHAVSFKLSAGGFEVLQASNGRDAMALLQSHTPDLVITDYQMPYADGFELCRFLRSRHETATVPIILLTAKALELSEEAVKAQWGLEAVFMKPFSPRCLLSTVQQALRARPAAVRS